MICEGRVAFGILARKEGEATGFEELHCVRIRVVIVN